MRSSRLRLSPKLVLVAAGLAALIVAAPQAFADFSLTDWRYVKPVSLPAELRREGLVEVAPDREVFAGAASGLVDLRIIADDGTEAPYKLEVSRGERQRVSIPVAIRDKGYVRGQYTTATGELTQEGALHNEIEILTPAANFLRNVTVEASDDGVTWATIAEQEIYDLTVREPGFTTRDTRVKYPESTARYLRLRIADDAEGPVEVSGASVFFVKETPAREVSWPASISSISQDTDRRTTLVDVDLGTRGLPSHRLVIEASEVNFYREVDLQTSADGVQWRPSGSRSAIFAYDTPKFVGSDLVVTHPESTSRFIRIIIFNEDNPPLDVERVEVYGIRRTLVFSADPRRSYSLYYGNAEARRPSYDIERILPYLATEGLPEARLGPQTNNPQFVEELPPPEPVSERLPWLFPSVVAVVAVVVAVLLVAVLRQARKILPPPPNKS